MGKFFLSRNLLAFVAACGFLGFFFNNCGQVQTMPTKAEQLPLNPSSAIEMTAKISAIKANLASPLTSGFCQSSDSYSCVKKVFSRNLRSEKLGLRKDECIDEIWGRICPEIREFAYNTEKAAEACRESCTESYDFEEYSCHLKLGAEAGIYPLVVTEPHLNDAIKNLHLLCLKINTDINGDMTSGDQAQ